MQLDQCLGYLATTIFSLMYVPQLLKTIKTKSIEDVSLPMFVMGFIGNIVALTYATMIKQPPLQVKYVIALIAIGIYITVYYKIKESK